MAKCEYCGKEMSFGIKVSHSHRRSNRTWKPNIKKVKAIVNGSPKSAADTQLCQLRFFFYLFFFIFTANGNLAFRTV